MIRVRYLLAQGRLIGQSEWVVGGWGRNGSTKLIGIVADYNPGIALESRFGEIYPRYTLSPNIVHISNN